jgi:hypothetical protein
MMVVAPVSLWELLAEASLDARRAGHIVRRGCMDAERKRSPVGMLAGDPELVGLLAILIPC